ncbi:hypothetical protein GMMP15_1080020 [Candidatus Magnetomoraceae bacterium gMMP-15]
MRDQEVWKFLGWYKINQPFYNCFFVLLKIRIMSGPVAQLRLERTPDKREVGGSSPPRPTIENEK